MPRLGEVNTGSSFRRRLGYFLLGTAIGLFMLGFVRNELAKRKAAMHDPQPAPSEPTSPTSGVGGP